MSRATTLTNSSVSRRRPKNDFIVHRAAAERVRMAHYADTLTWAVRFFNDRFKVTVGRWYIKVAFWIHNRIFDSKISRQA